MSTYEGDVLSELRQIRELLELLVELPREVVYDVRVKDDPERLQRILADHRR